MLSEVFIHTSRGYESIQQIEKIMCPSIHRYQKVNLLFAAFYLIKHLILYTIHIHMITHCNHESLLSHE